ncbi:MAG: hypothetical protein SPJ34_01345 [Candidatus Ornithospirochaeta sp.]|nr:hypothetical protein [Candidatus Ornithospirochaeta sp.]
MDYRYFTEEEDRKLTEKVLRFNSLEEGEEKEVLRTQLRERVSLLLYLLPIRNVFLSADDAAEFYIENCSSIDRFIETYAISHASFMAYFSSICRYRSLTLLKKKHDESLLTRTEELSETAEECISGLYTEEEPICDYHSENGVSIENLSLGESIEAISGYIPGKDLEEGTDAEKWLSAYLASRRRRRQFLLFLLTLPDHEDPWFIAGVSRVLRVDSLSISQFYMKRKMNLERIRDNDRIEKNRRVAARHWKMMKRIENRLFFEASSEKHQELMDTYSRLQEAYRKRRNDIAKAERGFTQRELADIISVSRSTIASAVKDTETALSQAIMH